MRTLKHMLRRPPIRMGNVDNSRIRTTPIRNAGFVSFVSQTGCLRVRDGDFHDARLRRQKRFRVVALIALTAACTWFAIESAKALALY